MTPSARYGGDAIALVAGLLVPLGFAPFGWFPLPILGLALALHAWLAVPPRRAWWRGWLFGLGMFGFGVGWVHISIHQFGGNSLPTSLAMFPRCAKKEKLQHRMVLQLFAVRKETGLLFFLAAFLGLSLGCSPGPAGSQSQAGAYPRKTVTVICPWAAGGGTDRLARFWAEALHKQLGKPFVVVNRTGGSGAIGHEPICQLDA